MALPLLFLCACSCGRAPSADESASEEIGSDTEEIGSSGTGESSGDLPPEADLPEEEMCVNASGDQVDLSDALWQVEFDQGQQAVLLIAGTAHFASKVDDSEWRLSVVDLDLGSREQSDHPLLAANVSTASLHWTPNEELLHFQVADSHNIFVQRFSGVDLVDAVQLEDDHSRVGWDGGSVGWGMVSAGETGFTLLGNTRGDTEPNGDTREVVWRKNGSPYLFVGVGRI